MTMDTFCKAIILLMLHVVASSNMDSEYCESIVSNWAKSAFNNELQEDRSELRDLLFFLHIPRSGGRTYFHCFLRKLYASDMECPRSYDRLHFDPSKHPCRLMATHDDYSMMTKLPKQRTSVVTILRNPVDRVFSIYEFAVEVAARFLIHRNLTSAIQMSRRLRTKIRGVSTLDIWPWKYLVPWMREDLFARRDSRKLKNTSEMEDHNDPYNMEDIVMPLHLFINDPLAHEIVHNGATFQVAGLTNNSCLEESQKLRQCVKKYPKLNDYILSVAKKRLNRMYVGLTEHHKASAAILMNMVEDAFISSGNQSLYKYSRPESSVSVSEPHRACHLDHRRHAEEQLSHESLWLRGNMTAVKLMEEYEHCISTLRKSQRKRRVDSLKGISPAKFSSEARRKISKTVIEQIMSLNYLDMELYKHAQQLFTKQQRHLNRTLVDLEELHKTSLFGLKDSTLMVVGITKAALLSITIIFLALALKRRTSKVKV